MHREKIANNSTENDGEIHVERELLFYLRKQFNGVLSNDGNSFFDDSIFKEMQKSILHLIIILIFIFFFCYKYI